MRFIMAVLALTVCLAAAAHAGESKAHETVMSMIEAHGGISVRMDGKAPVLIDPEVAEAPSLHVVEVQ